MKPEFPLTDRQLIELLQRSYKAVDGLWFMMAEKDLDFETALKLDIAVWEIMPKIQVRKIKELTGVSGSTASELLPLLRIKFGMEEYEYTVIEDSPARLELRIDHCPWVELLRNANRLHIADRIGEEICTLDLGGWASHFHPGLKLEWINRDCAGKGSCSFAISAR